MTITPPPGQHNIVPTMFEKLYDLVKWKNIEFLGTAHVTKQYFTNICMNGLLCTEE